MLLNINRTHKPGDTLEGTKIHKEELKNLVLGPRQGHLPSAPMSSLVTIKGDKPVLLHDLNSMFISTIQNFIFNVSDNNKITFENDTLYSQSQSKIKDRV